MKKKKWVIAGSSIVILLVFAAVWILFLSFHEIMAIRYREDGTLEPIRIYLDGYYYGEYPDPYAKKINQILLRKNPIHVRIENYFDR